VKDEEGPDLSDWRQGDYALEPVELPLISIEQDEDAIIIADALHGVVVLTQSCDLIRPQEVKPYVQVAALVLVEKDEMERVKAGHAPARVHIEELVAAGLVVDLDIVATVDKENVVKWKRCGGCAGDEEQRRFAAALARHRQRFAFPDAFNDLVKPVRRWVEDKRKANSANGRLVNAIREIRVHTDNWENPTTLEFLVLLNDPAPAADLPEWEAAMKTLTKKGTHDKFPVPEFRLVTYEEISAGEYVASDRLDWDGLSDA
jgi:hypothetical protein